ncbi:MAG: hypothetical protein ACRDOI_34635 [Trebonia sp.]
MLRKDLDDLARLARGTRLALRAGPSAALAALTYAAFGVFGLTVVLVSAEPLHRLWGGCAAAGYGCAALACLALARLLPARRCRDIALAAAVGGAVVVPLCWLAAAGRGMPEVGVVAHSAQLLVAHGRPYESAARLGADVYGYNPYLPGMTLLGLPRALFGDGLATDPRIWDGLVFVAAFAAALRVAGVAGIAAGRRTTALAGSPLIAFPLAVSGNDLPVIGLICLGLALAARRGPRCPAWAGVVLGAACTLKATAWPALLIVGVLIGVRDHRRAAARFAGAAAAVLAVLVGPFLLLQPADLATNTIAFPLGLTRAHSPAASPLPGHLVAATGPVGHLVVVVLLAATAIALGVLLATRPPRTAVAAAGYLALALTALFTLAPATRWGYFVYPAAIGCWLWLSGLPKCQLTGRGRPGNVPRPPGAGGLSCAPRGSLPLTSQVS